MPTGTGVVDAFKSISWSFLVLNHSDSYSVFLDLIRHGKNHNHHNNRNDGLKTRNNDYIDSSLSPPNSTRAFRHQQTQAQQVHNNNHVENPESQPQDVSPGHREAAEMIVNEEREASSKMPSYKGLENFKLTEKMGEWVSIEPSDISSTFQYPYSGAFSNVYKAIDISGKKVAGMLFLLVFM